MIQSLPRAADCYATATQCARPCGSVRASGSIIDGPGQEGAIAGRPAHDHWRTRPSSGRIHHYSPVMIAALSNRSLNDECHGPCCQCGHGVPLESFWRKHVPECGVDNKHEERHGAGRVNTETGYEMPNDGVPSFMLAHRPQSSSASRLTARRSALRGACRSDRSP